MKTAHIHRLAATAIALCLAAPAMAQQAPQEEGLGDIIVTAQRRTERLQDVPISATALDGAGLAAKAVTSLDRKSVV